MAREMGEIALLALGVMISPSAITLVILMVLRRRGMSTPAAFIGARALAMFAIIFSILVFFRNLDFSPESTSSTVTSAVKLGIGVLLLVLALGLALSKSGKSGGGEAGWLQRRMDSVEHLSPLPAFGLGFAFGIVSPRSLFLSLAAAASILHANLSALDGITALVAFIVIANLGVTAPLIIYAASPQKSAALLDDARKWIMRHQRAIILTVLVVVGAYLVVKGTLELL